MPVTVDTAQSLRWSNHPTDVQLAMVNNMPDSVISDTESQFIDLLQAASGEIPVRLSLFSLPGIPRQETARRRMAQRYQEIDEIWNRQFDAVIITGTEPRQPDLRQEPYWAALAELLDWAQENTVSTVLSCLAAHAGVLHSDGIAREPLTRKQFGVFEFQRTGDHHLTSHTGNVLPCPHSRWNEVRSDALTEGGYTVLSQSAEAGVDLFVKMKRKSLVVHFQGHPEYGKETLLGEYRRDTQRYLKGTRDNYPTLPRGYLSAAAVQALSDFEKYALANRSPALIHKFPNDQAIGNLGHPWKSNSERIYRNWLHYVLSRRSPAPANSVVSQIRANPAAPNPIS